jgi:predicted PurR-regulated permease PerM
MMAGCGELERELRAAAAQFVNTDSLRSLLGYATEFAITLLALLVTFFVSLYLAMDAPRVLDWIRGLVPGPYLDVYDAILADVAGVWGQFFRGQLTLMLIVGALTTIGLVILGVPYALGLGLIAGILEVVPRLGPVLATLPAMTVALVSESSTIDGLSGVWFAAAVLVLYVLIQQAENNILVPRVLGGSVNLHPAVVLVAALAGAKLAGVVGIVLAAPLLGSARVIGSWVFHQLTRTDTVQTVE